MTNASPETPRTPINYVEKNEGDPGSNASNEELDNANQRLRDLKLENARMKRNIESRDREIASLEEGLTDCGAETERLITDTTTLQKLLQTRSADHAALIAELGLRNQVIARQDQLLEEGRLAALDHERALAAKDSQLEQMRERNAGLLRDLEETNVRKTITVEMRARIALLEAVVKVMREQQERRIRSI